MECVHIDVYELNKFIKDLLSQAFQNLHFHLSNMPSTRLFVYEIHYQICSVVARIVFSFVLSCSPSSALSSLGCFSQTY